MIGAGIGIPFSPRRNVAGYIPEAVAYFDAVGDIPEVVKPIYNDLFIALVSTGVYAEPNFRGFLATPSLQHDKSIIDLKTLTKLATWRQGSTPYTTPFNVTYNGWTPKGFSFDDGNILTGYNSSILQNESSHCNIIVTFRTVPVKTGFLAGAFSSPNSNTIAPNYTGGYGWMDSKNITVGAGRQRWSSATGEAGVYILNRTSDTSGSVWVNNTKVLDITTTGGSLPNLEDVVNTFSNAGTPQTPYNETEVCADLKLPTGLSDTDLTTIRNALITWQQNMQMIEGSYDKVLVLDGNSHTVMHYRKIFRCLGYKMITTGYDLNCFGVSGQTNTQMIADAASQIDPVFAAQVWGRKILIFFENTNEHHLNGKSGVISSMETYCAARKAADAEVIVVACKMFARNSSGNADGETQVQYDQSADTINQGIVVGSNIDLVIAPPVELWRDRSEFSTDAEHSAALTAIRQNTTYMQTDQIHATDLGYELWGLKIYNELTAYLATL